MGNISEDTSAQLNMLKDAYICLREKNPDHELLKLAEMHDDEMGFNFSQKYSQRYVRANDNWKVQGYARYTEELKRAVWEESQLELTVNKN